MQTTACDGFSSSTADEGLADLQPEDSEGEEEGVSLKDDLSPEQKVRTDYFVLSTAQ